MKGTVRRTRHKRFALIRINDVFSRKGRFAQVAQCEERSGSAGGRGRRFRCLLTGARDRMLSRRLRAPCDGTLGSCDLDPTESPYFQLADWKSLGLRDQEMLDLGAAFGDGRIIEGG